MRRLFVLLPIMVAGCAIESAPIGDPMPSETPAEGAPAPGHEPGPGTAHEARVLDVTSDGIAIFVRGESLVATDLADGGETVLAERFGASGRALVDGRAVAFWTDVEGGLGTLGTFTKAQGRGGAVPASVAGVFAASADGSRSAFVAHATNGRADVVVGDATAIADVAVGAAECAPMLAWANDSLLASTCGATDTAPAIRAVKGGAVTTILAGAKRGWALDDAKARAFVIDRTGKASVRTLGSSGVTAVDRDVVWGRFAPDGDHVLYRTSANDLRRAVLRSDGRGTATPPSTLIEGVRNVDAISPSGDWMLASEAPPDASNDACTRSDVHLTPVPPGMPFIPTPTVPVDLVTTATGQALGFTADNRFAVYVADLPAKGAALGTLRVREAKDVGVGADTELAKGVLGARILEGTTTIVFARARGETFDLVSADAARSTSGAAVTVLVEDASPAFATTADRIVYTKRGSSSVAAKAIAAR